jgi:hypothetical protein
MRLRLLKLTHIFLLKMIIYKNVKFLLTEYILVLGWFEKVHD